jgi:ABC-type proline/glycine betaine transport system permease subunit
MAGFTDVHNRLMSVYPDVGEIWYFAVLCFAILCGCLGVGLWETYTTPAVVIYGIILCAFCVIPVGIIRSITGLEVTMNVLAEFVSLTILRFRDMLTGRSVVLGSLETL